MKFTPVTNFLKLFGAIIDALSFVTEVTSLKVKIMPKKVL